MRFEEYRKQDAVSLAGLIAKRQVSAEEVLEAAIARAEQVNPAINAIEPGTASPSLSLEDTSPPWSADAARPECGHYWRRPRDSEPPGHGAHPGPMCRAAENHSRNPS